MVAYLRAGAEETPAAVLDRFIQLWRQVIVASGAASGCVVAGVALDTGAGDELMDVARESFRAWETALAELLERTGLSRQRANGIALATLAGMEGALILCRAEGTVQPLDDVAEELMRLVPPASA